MVVELASQAQRFAVQLRSVGVQLPRDLLRKPRDAFRVPSRAGVLELDGKDQGPNATQGGFPSELGSLGRLAVRDRFAGFLAQEPISLL